MIVAYMRTPSRQLSAVLWPAARRAVIGLLCAEPDRELHLRDIARRVGMAPATIHREVAALAEAGILACRRSGHQTYYRADPACPIAAELRGIALKTTGLAETVRRALAPLGTRIEWAFVYGSMANGTALPGSDVDLCVVGELDLRDLVDAARLLRDELGREVNPVVMRPEVFAERRRAGDRFVASMLSGPRIDIAGGADEA
jgi:predicted nucleotidyltransferase